MPNLDDLELTWKVVKEALRNVPAVKWGVGVTGLVGLLVIILKFKIDLWIAVFGVIIMLALMVGLVVFSHLAKMESSFFFGAAKALIGSITAMMIAVPLLLFTSTFFNWPLKFRDRYFSGANIQNGDTGNKANSDTHAGSSGSIGSDSHANPQPDPTPVATPVKRVTGADGRQDKLGNGPANANVKPPALIDKKDCDNFAGSQVDISTPKESDAYVGTFTREVLDQETKKRLSYLEVRCGDSGQEKAMTDIDGIFSCTLPANTTSLFVEILDSRYEHFHKRLNSGCHQPILLRRSK